MKFQSLVTTTITTSTPATLITTTGTTTNPTTTKSLDHTYFTNTNPDLLTLTNIELDSIPSISTETPHTTSVETRYYNRRQILLFIWLSIVNIMYHSVQLLPCKIIFCTLFSYWL